MSDSAKNPAINGVMVEIGDTAPEPLLFAANLLNRPPPPPPLPPFEEIARQYPSFKIEYIEMVRTAAVEFGATNAQLARLFSVSATTIGRWMQEIPAFGEAVAVARAKADAEVERSLFKRAKGFKKESVKIFCNREGEVTEVPYQEYYPPETAAATFWLKNRRKEEWQDVSKQEVTGAGGAQLPVINITLNTTDGALNIQPAINTTSTPVAELPQAAGPAQVAALPEPRRKKRNSTQTPRKDQPL